MMPQLWVRSLPLSLPLPCAVTSRLRALDELAHCRALVLVFIRPGKSVENAFIESFNDRLRQKWLDQH